MAHDNQVKESPEGRRVLRFDYPTVGDLYWDRYSRSAETATSTLGDKALILEREE